MLLSSCSQPLVDAVPSREAPNARRITLKGDVVVFPDLGRVEVPAITCIEAGWLEQIACAPHTREHESLVVVPVRPSDVHAALLLAGLKPGAPGKWTYGNDSISVTPPTGDLLHISVRYEKAGGASAEEPVGTWIRDGLNNQPFPDKPWVFAGSLMAPNRTGRTGAGDAERGEHYVADFSGSIIGLVTFGDEVIGFSQVISDQASVQEPEWEVNPGRVPAPGTHVTLIIERARSR